MSVQSPDGETRTVRLSAAALMLCAVCVACAPTSELDEADELADVVLPEPAPVSEDWETAGTLDPAELRATLAEVGLRPHTVLNEGTQFCLVHAVKEVR